MTLEEIDCLGILTLVPQLGPVRIRKLIDYFGSAVTVFEQPWTEVIACLRLKSIKISDWPPQSCMELWKRHRRAADSLGVKLISWDSPDYPVLLKALDDAPPLIYLQGDLSAFSIPGVGIIGTRTPSIYGTCLAQQTAKELAQMRCSVVSGLARGIDTAAHHGALELSLIHI